MKRSPWHGLTGSEALELEEELSRPENLARERDEALWSAHLVFCRRAAAALSGNDLRGALRAADIAAAALLLQRGQVLADVPGQAHAVVDQHPATAGGTEATSSTRPAHREHSGPGRDVRGGPGVPGVAGSS